MTEQFNRRDVLKLTAGAMISTVGSGCFETATSSSKNTVPSYLRGYENLYYNDPREAARAWFADADFGLFMHYGPVPDAPPRKTQHVVR